MITTNDTVVVIHGLLRVGPLVAYGLDFRYIAPPLYRSFEEFRFPGTHSMRYSSLVDRIGGESADIWAIHYEARARQNRGEDILILSLGQESDQYTPSVIQQTAINSIKSGRHHYPPVLGEDALQSGRRHA